MLQGKREPITREWREERANDSAAGERDIQLLVTGRKSEPITGERERRQQFGAITF